MNFDTLHELIPHTIGKKLHTVSMSPYNAVTLAMPGRHQTDTAVPGGDFVVMVDDTNLGWVKHQFTHDDLFNDIEQKRQENPVAARNLMQFYAKTILGGYDPEGLAWPDRTFLKSIHHKTFLYAVQCLGVAEHRRYGQHEKRGGGRFLPARFSSGIVEGLWTAADCKAVQRRGRIGLDNLIAEHGKPRTLKEWANG